MTTSVVFDVSICVLGKFGRNALGLAVFDRMPTVDEACASVLLCQLESTCVDPEIQERWLQIYLRGIPVPPEIALTITAAVYEYPEGWIRVRRRNICLLDPAPEMTV